MNTTKRIVTTAKLPKGLHQQMLENIIHDGYGMRGKSKWIAEAIEALLSFSNYPELVDIATEAEGLNEVISLRTNIDLTIRLEQAVIEIRKHYPAIEGVKSKIIRTSILQRLLRS